MSGQVGFWDVQDRLSQLSRHGDPLEKLSATVDTTSRFSGRSWRERCLSAIAARAAGPPLILS